MINKNKYKIKCKYCGKIFYDPRHYKTRLFCSRSCAMKYRNDNKLIKHRRKFTITKDYLYDLYRNKKLSSIEIAKLFGVHKKTVLRKLKEYNIPTYSLSESRKGKKYPKLSKVKQIQMKKLWENVEFRKRMIKALLKGNLKKPTKPEQRLINVIKKFNLPFKYVGDGKVLIYGLCPDFIECNGRKIVIEVFGDYWHKEKKNINWYQTEWGRKAIYSQLGYKCIIFWESELVNRYNGKMLSDEEILNKIKSFLKKVGEQKWG